LALDFKIGVRFVGCDIKDEKPDGSLLGIWLFVALSGRWLPATLIE
jgi:hypothetical protein